jgi:Arc/MetJ-type ribon-helix-helix transcriptional regulator
MGLLDGKSCQLRVRVSNEERDQLEKLRSERGRGETISELVREAISLLTSQKAAGKASGLSPKNQRRVERLAVLLKREPEQVEDACVEGVLDLIESKCEVPLIVMETHLHLQYYNRGGTVQFPWNTSEPEEASAAAPKSSEESQEKA